MIFLDPLRGSWDFPSQMRCIPSSQLMIYPEVFWCREAVLHFELSLDVDWSYSSCLMLSPTALEENNFSYVHLLFYFFDHYPNLMNVGEDWKEDWLVGQKPCLLAYASLHDTRPVLYQSTCCTSAPLPLHFWTRCQDVWCFFSWDPWSQILRCWLNSWLPQTLLQTAPVHFWDHSVLKPVKPCQLQIAEM